MPYDSSGNYTLPAGSTATTGTTILASTHNTPTTDVAAALNLPFLRDGRTPATGDFAMASHKITGLADATNSTDALPYGQAGETFVRVDAAQSFTDGELLQAMENLGGAARILEYPAQATTSGTSFNFNDIPSWVKRIEVTFVGVSLNATEDILIQLGTASSFETSGYSSCRVVFGTASTNSQDSTAGLIVAGGQGANAYHGVATICRHGDTGNTWCMSGNMSLSGFVSASGGSKLLSDVLTRLRVLRSGSSSFDAGSIGIKCMG